MILSSKQNNAHDDIVKYIQNFIDESEVTEIGDYIISFNREDLKNRIDTLCSSSLTHKQNTSLFDFDFQNNRIIKFEILGKGSLKDFLTDEGDEYKVTGLRDLNTFVTGQQVNKSLVNINSASNLDRAKVIHERNKSSISLFLEQKNLLKNPVSEEQYKRIYAKYKDVSAISRDLKITKETSIPRHTSVLSLKEGRIFFIGGNIKDDTCSHFLEYIEDSNTIYPHPPMNIERESHGVCIVNSKIYAIGGYNFRENVWLDSIESISLPDNPQIEYQNNYDIIWMYEPIESNQKGVSPRSEWETYKDRMKYPRSHMSVITQFERFIYVFWGKNGQTDPALINSANEESLHSIERFDCVSEKWEEYIIKSCHKINKMYSPGTVQIASLKRKDPGILFFGGKTEFKSKKSVKHYDNVMLMFLQSNKSRQLESKYYVKGKEFKVKVIQSEALQKKIKRVF